jgi:hypothetical protein
MLGFLRISRTKINNWLFIVLLDKKIKEFKYIVFRATLISPIRQTVFYTRNTVRNIL